MAVIERPMDGRLTEELCLTVGWDDGVPAYAVEGNIRASGATLAWLADLVQATPADIAALAATADSAGVVLVPAFTGLGAPHWDPGAVGLISGITLGTTLSNIARAALESIAFQVDDVVRAALPAIGNPTALLVDGGPTQNADLMQLQADTSGCVVRRPSIQNLSAMGAAHLAGLGAGLWTRDALERLERPGEEYRPRPSTPRSIEGRRAWAAAVGRSRWHARTHGLT
jgi:glycerol kinase